MLIVVVLLSLAAYKYSELMLAEYRASDSYSRTAQAKALADSGINYTAALLSDPTAFTSTLNSNPWDNASVFQDILVQDNDAATRRGRFSILTIRDPNDPLFLTQPYRFGVTDEAGKLNLNALMTLATTDTVRLNMLMQIPGMTEPIANCILDWLDNSSSIPRTNGPGAKDETYMALDPPYHVKNGPMDSLEELLLIQGVTPQLLYGSDVNRNGVQDPGEDNGNATGDPNTDLLGWQQYLTIYSRQPNLSNEGNPRIFLNDSNLTNLYTNLQNAVGGDLALFIVGYRLYGGSTGTTNASGRSSQTFKRLSGATAGSVTTQINTAMQSANAQSWNRNKISSLFTLTTQQVTVTVPNTSGGGSTSQTLPNPLMDPTQSAALLPILFDQTTTTQQSDLTPRININTASQIVLSMLPNLQPADVQQIVQAQQMYQQQVTSGGQPDPMFQTPAWLLTQTTLPIKTLSAIESFITAQSQVYSFMSLGYFDGPGPTVRIQAVVDANNGRPHIVFYRPMTELGKGFNLPKATGQ